MASENEPNLDKIRDDLRQISDEITSIREGDKALLLYLNRIARHCEQRQHLNKHSSNDSHPEGKSEATESTDIDHDQADGLSRDTSNSAGSPSSLSVLGARELFPGTPSSSDGNSSQSSSPSPRTHFMKRLTHLRGEQVKAMMSSMQERMKRRDSF